MNLNNIIRSITEDLNEKKKHILYLQRKTQDFEDDLFKAENNLAEQFKCQKLKISVMNIDILELVEKNNVLLNEDMIENYKIKKYCQTRN